MIQKTVIILLILALPLAAHAQPDYTIPKKHRVIQEKSSQSRTVPLGSKISDITFTTLQNKTHTLSSLVQQGPIVFVFLSTECPVAQRYAMRLKRMHTEFADKHVTFVGVYSNENDSVEDVKAYLAKAEYLFPIVKDKDGSLARHIGATMTPQAHLIDTSGVLRYRGSIDDNRYETRIKHHYLKDALVAIVSGKPVPMEETAAFGCTIHLPDLPTEKQITYSEHIAPILQKNCQTCHHQNGIAPFTFTDYDDVKVHAAKIAEQTQKRLMPPWKPVRGYGEFKNERYLSDTHINMILQWVKNGTPAGPQVNDKPEVESSRTWKLGKPDTITKIVIKLNKRSYNPDNIQTINIQNDFPKNMYIRAIDYQIENKKSVHGIIAKHDLSTSSQTTVSPDGRLVNKLNWTKPTIMDNNTLNVWTPSTTPSLLPQGTGFLLPQGAGLTLLLSYNPIESSDTINMRIGMYFSNAPKSAKVRLATLSKNSNQKIDMLSYQFKSDVYVLGVFPLMQPNLEDMRIIAKTPTGEEVKMLWIKSSDIIWNEIYHYHAPIYIPIGSRLEFDVVDNSENQSNPKSNNQKNKKVICQFYYVLASEYAPD